MVETKNGKKINVEFKSISEFYNYLCETPFNDAFRWEEHSSVSGRKEFTKTNSFEEAVDLMKNGWSEMASKLTKTLKTSKMSPSTELVRKQIISAVGYHPIVPLYLNGCPNNMVNSKMVATKQKVVTINKDISYNAAYSAETIIEESIKCLQIINKLEKQGIRCNLNVVFGTRADGKEIVLRLRVKNANEKMNISKLAFPLVHPSFLRRLCFRFEEVYPEFTKAFCHGYGSASDASQLKKTYNNEIFIPRVIKDDINEITNVDDLYTIH